MLPNRRAALPIVLLAALAACEDPYAPDLAPRGVVSFTYTGAASGEFLGDGRLNRRNVNAGTWAVGETNNDQGGVVLGVFAQQRREDNLWNAVILEVRGVQVGTFSCAVGSTDPCPVAMAMILGTRPISEDVEDEFGHARGTVTITQLTERRAVGTFSLTLQRVGVAEDAPTVQLTGSFDVPLEDF